MDTNQFGYSTFINFVVHLHNHFIGGYNIFQTSTSTENNQFTPGRF